MEEFQGAFLGLKDSFLDTAVIFCIPAMIFGVSFAINIDEENIKWTKTSFPITMTRILLGLISTCGLDYVMAFYMTGLSKKHSSIYVL